MADGGKKILVAEDEKPMAKAVSTKLAHAGFDVTTVNNGEEALEALGKDSFDLILLDLVMPRMDGWAVLEKLHADNNEVPIIVASNLSQDEDEKRARELGASDFLVKSNVSINEVIDRVTKVLS